MRKSLAHPTITEDLPILKMHVEETRRLLEELRARKHGRIPRQSLLSNDVMHKCDNRTQIDERRLLLCDKPNTLYLSVYQPTDDRYCKVLMWTVVPINLAGEPAARHK